VRDRLRAHGTDARRLTFEEIPGGTHSEAAWAGRTQRILLYLFGR
jgi:hypothetical protein